MKNVLVVCHGNRYRSPFAAGLMNLRWPSMVNATSAGVKQPIGSHPADLSARAAAVARGFSLVNHRARPITNELVKWAECILYMDNGNYKRLCERFPESQYLMVGLFEFAGKNRIPDPAFLVGEHKKAVYALIEKACEGFIRS